LRPTVARHMLVNLKIYLKSVLHFAVLAWPSTLFFRGFKQISSVNPPEQESSSTQEIPSSNFQIIVATNRPIQKQINSEFYKLPKIFQLKRNQAYELALRNEANNFALSGDQRLFKDTLDKIHKYQSSSRYSNFLNNFETWWAGGEWVANIGHSAAGLELIHNINLKRESHSPKVSVFCTSTGTSNPYLLHLFSEKIPIFRMKLEEYSAIENLFPNHRLRFEYQVDRTRKVLNLYESINSHRKAEDALLEIPLEVRSLAVKHFSELNIDLSAPFIAIHVREGATSSQRGATNGNLESLYKGIHTLIDLGFQVIRVGQKNSKPFNLRYFGKERSHRILDYTNSPLKNHVNDIVLFALCEFFVGCDSGPICVSPLFGKPVLRLNANHALRVEKYRGYVVPTLFKDKSRNRLLTLTEQFSSEIGWTQDLNLPSDIYRVYNSESVIRDAMLDMVELLKQERPSENSSQVQFRNLASQYTEYPGMTIPGSFIQASGVEF